MRALLCGEVKPQIPRLRSPGFPVGVGGVGGPHAPFFYGKAHTRLRPVPRGRKSGSDDKGEGSASMESDDLARNRWVPQVSLLRPGIRATELQRKRYPLVIPTRISCHAALDEAAHEVRHRHQPPQEIRGSGAEGSAVSLHPKAVTFVV
jgi:hypothetical protein